MEEPIIEEEFVKKIGDMFIQIQELLKEGLIPLEAKVNHTIKHRIKDEDHIDRLLSDLLDYTQIDEGLEVFKRLCRYSFYIYPQLIADYISYYRDYYDLNYAKDDDEVNTDD
jgi:signal transduction histidine kinase